MAKAKEPETEEEPGVPTNKRLYNFLLVLLGSSLLFAFCYELLFPYGSSDSSPSKKEACDIFSGKWIQDSSDPPYTNSSCSFISNPQNCLTNGRPDTGYLHWRWKPYDCEVPPMDTNKFLNKMRSKSLAFIGDSIFRNQMESLLCLLSKVEEAILVYHDEKFQSKTWYLPSHNITLGLIWAPFLIKSTEARSKNNIQLYLDVLDYAWTSQYHKYDYVMLSGGQWFLKETIFWENNTVIGCHDCMGKKLTELGMDYSYHKALRLVFQFMSTSEHKPLVVLKTWTPSHFEHGKWNTGGICNRTEPFKEGEYTADPVDATMRNVELETFQEGSNNGLRVKLLDTYHLSLLRPDGHPGPYRRFHPDISKKLQNDCLHWCLPGPIDTWNEMLMEILMNEAELRSAF
ncbi:protein trichome birefringence-like 26 [Musa acuminata AAA Group]|uniref:protein trichome birefringence-like 26 n=1 Tax=Musa acuminata AAA Group TaxID=214697 RepID=UPI0031DF3D96